MKGRKLNKKGFEKHLNEIGVPSHDKASLGGRCNSKNYGTWLRRNDKVEFEVKYKKILTENIYR